MSYQKIEIFIEKLLRKSLLGFIEWEPTEDQSVFKVSFPDYSITISQHINTHEAEKLWTKEEEEFIYYVLSIYNNKDILIDKVNDKDLSEQYDDASKFFKNLYETVRRISMGADKALDELIKELGEDE